MGPEGRHQNFLASLGRNAQAQRTEPALLFGGRQHRLQQRPVTLVPQIEQGFAAQVLRRGTSQPLDGAGGVLDNLGAIQFQEGIGRREGKRDKPVPLVAQITRRRGAFGHVLVCPRFALGY